MWEGGNGWGQKREQSAPPFILNYNYTRIRFLEDSRDWKLQIPSKIGQVQGIVLFCLIVKRDFSEFSLRLGGSDGKESACNVGDQASIPGSGRSLGEINVNPLHYSCLENSMDRGAWQATVHGVTESDMTEQLHFLSKGHLETLFSYRGWGRKG